MLEDDVSLAESSNSKGFDFDIDCSENTNDYLTNQVPERLTSSHDFKYGKNSIISKLQQEWLNEAKKRPTDNSICIEDLI